MDKIDFTDEERALILGMASTRAGKLERILGHLTWVGPGIAFIVYGLLSEQLHALAIGALSLVCYQLWGMLQEVRYWALYADVFRKVARLIEPRTTAEESERG